jgi:superfamily II DNA/RNA helicase
VIEYIPYTNRLAITQDFTPSDHEQRLYDEISEYLRRDQLLAMPSSQRQLITMVFRKLLASSTFAIAGTLETLVNRLKTDLSHLQPEEDITDAIAEDFESLDEIKEEWAEDEEGSPPQSEEENIEDKLRVQLLRAEIEELEGYRQLAVSITENAKGQALLVALEKGFAKLAELGAARKAVIFTESRRTQAYLKRHLEEHDYKGQIVLFNASNADPESQQIYKGWCERHKGDDQISGSRTADLRSALVEHFRDHASILIATESGAEGINLQFASLVVNYDLPWNPQRIEQRIGRCHRYGQKHDVVVINFLNRKNAADVRVFQLLSEKFRLFDGVFGASDEVLGAIESGVDFERRIAEIYQNCRTAPQIEEAFNTLHRELDEQIAARLAETRQKLLEHFDEEVHERLRLNREQTLRQISRFEEWLWNLTRHELQGYADFRPDHYAFHLETLPEGLTENGIRRGRYQFLTKVDEREPSIHYRLGHPLAELLISQSKSRQVAPHEVTFLYSQHGTRISIVESLIEKAGWLSLSQISIEALDTEDHLIFAAFTDGGASVDQETCERLFTIAGRAGAEVAVLPEWRERLATATEIATNAIIEEVATRNKNYFEQELEKVDKWAEDLKEALRGFEWVKLHR